MIPVWPTVSWDRKRSKRCAHFKNRMVCKQPDASTTRPPAHSEWMLRAAAKADHQAGLPRAWKRVHREVEHPRPERARHPKSHHRADRPPAVRPEAGHRVVARRAVVVRPAVDRPAAKDRSDKRSGVALISSEVKPIGWTPLSADQRRHEQGGSRASLLWHALGVIVDYPNHDSPA